MTAEAADFGLYAVDSWHVLGPHPPVEDPRVTYERAGEVRFSTSYPSGVTVMDGPPPDVCLISEELLTPATWPRAADRRLVRRGRLVRIAVDNCRCVYRLIAFDFGRNVYLARLARTFRWVASGNAIRPELHRGVQS